LNNDSLKRNSKATCAATVFEAELEDVSFTDETDENQQQWCSVFLLCEDA
jgi:hypothetical protein